MCLTEKLCSLSEGWVTPPGLTAHSRRVREDSNLLTFTCSVGLLQKEQEQSAASVSIKSRAVEGKSNRCAAVKHEHLISLLPWSRFPGVEVQMLI